MVLFRDFKEAERTGRAIGDARESMRVRSEFKFNKSSDPVRDGFFEAVRPFDFRVRALVVDKSRFNPSDPRGDRKTFYHRFIHLLMHHDDGALQNARVKIDGSGSQPFQREMKRYLRQRLDPGKIASLRFADSRRDNLIQLADMAVGAIARSYREGDRVRHNRWRLALGAKIENVRKFP